MAISASMTVVLPPSLLPGAQHRRCYLDDYQICRFGLCSCSGPQHMVFFRPGILDFLHIARLGILLQETHKDRKSHIFHSPYDTFRPDLLYSDGLPDS